MKRNRALAVLLTVGMLLALAGCGGNGGAGNGDISAITDTGDIPPEADSSVSEASAAKFETEDIQPLEKLYAADEEEFAHIQSLQTHITHIDNGGTAPVFAAGGKLYAAPYGDYEERAVFPDTPDGILFFDSLNRGESVYCFRDGKLGLYDVAHGEDPMFTDIAFDPETDFVAKLGSDSYFFVVSKAADGYVVRYYLRDDESGEMRLDTEAPLSEIENAEFADTAIEELIALPGKRNGYSIYLLTAGRDLYAVDDINTSGEIHVNTAAPSLSGVEQVFAPADVGNLLTVPIYSRPGDAKNVYSGVPGEDLGDVEDNLEISFPMPEEHTALEIQDIFQISGRLAFVFDNGDVYVSGEIGAAKAMAYGLEKLEDVSALNREGDILGMAGASAVNDRIYLLMSDGCIYYREL